MGQNESMLLAALADAAAALWQMGATDAAHKAEMAIADAMPFNDSLHDNERDELAAEDRAAWEDFHERRMEP